MSNQPIPNDFDLPQDYLDTFSHPLNDGTAVQLPFVAPFIWWMNGDNRLRQIGGAPFFGGWAADKEDLDLAIQERSGVIPTGFAAGTLVNRKGKEFDAYTVRNFGAAIIAHRKRWVTKDETGKSNSQMHILAYLGYYVAEQRKYVPWGPVVISGKGYASSFIGDALRDWEKRTAQARRVHANNIPAWLFYSPIGTFGEKPISRMVGSSAQSPVTPCQVYTPGEITVDFLRSAYVGRAVVDEMAELKKEAQAWLDDWKKPPEQHQQQAHSGGNGGYPPPPEEPPYEEDNGTPF